MRYLLGGLVISLAGILYVRIAAMVKARRGLAQLARYREGSE